MAEIETTGAALNYKIQYLNKNNKNNTKYKYRYM